MANKKKKPRKSQGSKQGRPKLKREE